MEAVHDTLRDATSTPVDLDALVALATSLAAEVKSLERRLREVKQQSAALRDHLITLQAKEATR
jgi:hypothetical protein